MARANRLTQDFTEVQDLINQIPGKAEKDTSAVEGNIAVFDSEGNPVDSGTGEAGFITDAEREKLAGIESGAEVNVQSDWSQGDSSADDYIKNRTHWIEGVEVEDAQLAWTGDTAATADFFIKDTSLHFVEIPPRQGADKSWQLDARSGNYDSVVICDFGFLSTLDVLLFKEGLGVQLIASIGNFSFSRHYDIDLDIDLSTRAVHKLDNEYLDMDITPTAASDKPVTSGGVRNAISALNGSNLEYTGNDGEYISGGDSINSSLLLLDDAVNETNGRLDNLKGSQVVYDGEDGDSVIVHGDTVDQCLKGLDDQAAYIIENYQYKISDIDTIRAGAALGATAYQKPSTGIPKSALASAVKTSLEKADTALQPSDLNGYATEEYVDEEVSGKQDTLISGQNIKTINGFSILGGGDLYFPGPVQSDWNEDDDGDYAYIKNKPTDLVHYDELSPTDPISAPNYATEEEVSQLRSEKADKDGYYPEMSVGSLVGTEVTQVEGITTIAKSTGRAKINDVKGKSLAWNQLVSDSATEVVVTSGHKYFSNIGGTKAIATSDGTAIAVTGGTDNIIDLTQLFGLGNEPSTVEEFESWLANNIGYRDYYSYNPGTIISNNTEALEITGLNQWDGEYTEPDQRYLNNVGEVLPSLDYRISSYIEVLGNTEYYFKNIVQNIASSPAICWYDSEKNFISGVNNAGRIYNKVITSPLNARYLRCSIYKPTADISSVSVSGSRNGQYEPYQKSEFALDLANITGKLNGEGESVTIFPEGMRSAGTAYDSLIVDEDGWCRKAVKRIAEVDMGNLTWVIQGEGTANERAQTSSIATTIRTVGNSEKANVLSVKYSATSANATYLHIKDMTVAVGPTGVTFVYDSALIGHTAAEIKTAMSGVFLIYELATPLEYVLDAPIYMGIKTQQGGVIRQLPENGSAPTTAPMRMDISYALPPEALISGSSLENLLIALKSANKISNYTMTYNATSGKWEFTIS